MRWAGGVGEEAAAAATASRFLTADRTDEETRASLGGVDLDRLAAVKERWDPTGVFGRLV